MFSNFSVGYLSCCYFSLSIYFVLLFVSALTFAIVVPQVRLNKTKFYPKFIFIVYSYLVSGNVHFISSNKNDLWFMWL